jgi:hypothetical protein
MIPILVEMPTVSQCSVSECAYNTDDCCHARAITVGDGVHPGCDTFFGSAAHSIAKDRHAGVGACKVSVCRHNEDFECGANSISVARSNDSVCCQTFQQR